MARTATPRSRKAAVSSPLGDKIANGARSAITAVRELMKPHLSAIKTHFDEHGTMLADHEARLAGVEASIADPQSPDELADQLVREEAPNWAKLL